MERSTILSPVAVLAGTLLVVAAIPLSSEEPASNGLSEQEMEEFLLNAEIVNREQLPLGITRPSRATLSDGKLTHDAHVQTVDVYKDEFRWPDGRIERNFRDSNKYNIAAYRLAKLLGLDFVPVSVERKISREKAALTWWVDDVELMEKDRRERQIKPPNVADWNYQIHQIWVFGQLIQDTDQNQDNRLITGDWKVWIIDFTRAFRTHKKLTDPEKLVRIDRDFLQALRDLDLATVSGELRPYLTGPEVKALLARRDRIIEFFDGEVAKKGEAAVFSVRPPR